MKKAVSGLLPHRATRKRCERVLTSVHHELARQLPRCQKAMNDHCVETFDEMNCRAAVGFCDSEMSTGYWASGQYCIGSERSLPSYSRHTMISRTERLRYLEGAIPSLNDAQVRRIDAVH